MEIVSLNTWGGELCEKLLRFLLSKNDADILCFQEVFSTPSLVDKLDISPKDRRLRLFSEIAKVLPMHTGFFSATLDEVRFLGDGTEYHDLSKTASGNVIFVRKDYAVEATGDLFVYGNRNSKDLGLTLYNPKTLQYLVIRRRWQRYMIFNFHGLWNGGDKDDCPERIEQSRNIAKFVAGFSGKRILCGDFNLNPHTDSMKIIEKDSGLLNISKEYGRLRTRTNLYRYFQNGSPFADYFFASPDITINCFTVRRDDFAEVSDHCALELTVDL